MNGVKIIFKVCNLGKTISPYLYDVASEEEALSAWLVDMHKRYPQPEKFKLHVGTHFTIDKVYVVE